MKFRSAILGTLWCIVVRDDDDLLRSKVVFIIDISNFYIYCLLNLHLPQTQYPSLSRRMDQITVATSRDYELRGYLEVSAPTYPK